MPRSVFDANHIIAILCGAAERESAVLNGRDVRANLGEAISVLLGVRKHTGLKHLRVVDSLGCLDFTDDSGVNDALFLFRS